MKAFTKWWFAPPMQPEGAKVEFELRPLDQRTYLFLQGEVIRSGRKTRLSVDGILEAFDYGVTNWRGIETEFSESAKRQVVTGMADPRWAVWQASIAGELYMRALLGEPEKKTS